MINCKCENKDKGIQNRPVSIVGLSAIKRDIKKFMNANEASIIAKYTTIIQNILYLVRKVAMKMI